MCHAVAAFTGMGAISNRDKNSFHHRGHSVYRETLGFSTVISVSPVANMDRVIVLLRTILENNMDVDATRRYLLGKPEALEDYPFGPDVAVMKVRGKMFATLGQESGEGRMNLKCDPDQALALRDIFAAVLPGYHMNKKHWNTIKLDGSIPEGEIQRMIDHSFALVVGGLPKKMREGMEVRHCRDALYGAQN